MGSYNWEVQALASGTMGSGNDEGLNFDDLLFSDASPASPMYSSSSLCSLCLVLSSSTAHRFSLHVLVAGSLIMLIHAFQLCIPKDNPPFFFQPWMNKVLGKNVE